MNILFVCLGNICRSPAAEAVCTAMASQRGLSKLVRSDSVGTSNYHIGESSDKRMKAAAAEKGINILHKGRQVSQEDLDRYDLILAMDSQNHSDLLRMAEDYHVEKIRMFRDFDPEGSGDVPDPYFGGDTGFSLVMRMLMRTCSALLDQVEEGRWEQ